MIRMTKAAPLDLPAKPVQPLVFADFDAIGFDLDHTLCKYRLDKLFPLIYQCIVEYLVETKGYDRDLLKQFETDRDFCTKGLVLDLKKGNFLKFSQEGYITKASHGTTPLNDQEITDIYGPHRTWKPEFTFLSKTLQQKDGVRYFENYFDLPGAVVCARVIDSIDKKAGKRLENYNFWKDVIAGFGVCFNRDSFKNHTGGYFSALKENPLEYVELCSDSVKNWLRRIKKAGKTLFILTSSHVDYAKLLLCHILGPDWESYFDVFVCYARKPGFFTEHPIKRPFYTIKDDKEAGIVGQLEPSCKWYSQGNCRAFTGLLGLMTGQSQPKVLYFGDSIRSDVFPVHTCPRWTPVLILEEMETEGMVDIDCYGSSLLNGEEGQQPEADDDSDTQAPAAKKSKYSHIHFPSVEEKVFLSSNQWGSFLTDKSLTTSEDGNVNGVRPSTEKGVEAMNTFWGHLIRTYSAIAVPQLEFVSDLPLEHEFLTFKSSEKSFPDRNIGFYPSMPKALF